MQYKILADNEQLNRASATAVLKELLKPLTLIVKDMNDDSFCLVEFQNDNDFLNYIKNEYVNNNRKIIRLL